MRRLYWILYTVAAACCSCAGVQRALDEGGEKGTAAVAGASTGLLVWFLGPVGWVGGALASLSAAIAALLVGGGDKTIHEAPANPWVGIAAVVAGVLLLRSWAHWLPPLLEVLKNSAKGAPRALLGGRSKREPTKTRFVRRAD